MYKCRKFNNIVTVPSSECPTKITPKARCVRLQEVTKNPGVTSKDLQTPLSRRKPIFSKKNIAACLKFAKGHLDEPEGYWKEHCGDNG